MASKIKLVIISHDGTEEATTVDSYDPVATQKAIKEAQSHDTNEYTVLIGDNIYDARDIKRVIKR